MSREAMHETGLADGIGQRLHLRIIRQKNGYLGSAVQLSRHRWGVNSHGVKMLFPRWRFEVSLRRFEPPNTITGSE